jgi:DNA-binding transcriptional MerR regulator
MIGAFPRLLAAKVTGVTPATLDNWNSRGILDSTIAPGPPPQARLYTFRDLVAIRVLVELREAGIDPRGLRRVVEYLRKRKGLSATEALASTSLVTDGHDVFELEGDVTLSALRRPGQRVVFVVPFDELVTELQIKARAALQAA